MSAFRLLLPLAAAAITAGCGARSERLASPPPIAVSVALDAAPTVEDGALLAGIANGRFTRSALRVTLRPGLGKGGALQALIAGQARLAVLTEAEVLMARDRGLALVAVAALGRAGAAPGVLAVRTRQAEHGGELVRTFLQALAAAAAEVRARPAAGAAALLAQTETAQPEARRRAIPARRSAVHARSSSHAHPAAARQNGPRAPIAATQASGGTRQSSSGAGESAPSARRRLEGELQTASSSTTGEPYGYQGAARWAASAGKLRAEHLLRRNPDVLAPPYTNEFLPGQGI